MKVVLDTNILISAALSPKGNPAKIIELIADNQEVQVFYCKDILAEYKEVLSRPRLNIDHKMSIRVMDLIKKTGILIKPTPGDIPLPDESDRIFYDTARTAGAILITGNIKHYPIETFIMSPFDFLKKVVEYK